MKSKHLLLVSALVALMGAGCVDLFKPHAAPKETSNEPNIFVAATTTQASATSTPAEPKHWEVTDMSWINLAFAPPAGYWVYFMELDTRQYLVPGKPPTPGTGDPLEDAIKRSVADFWDVRTDPKSFPNWESFELATAHFACAKGTDETFETCGNKLSREVKGKTPSGFPYHQFTLAATHQKTGAARGTRTYIMVRLGETSDRGVFFEVTNTAKIASVMQLVKSMKLK